MKIFGRRIPLAEKLSRKHSSRRRRSADATVEGVFLSTKHLSTFEDDRTVSTESNSSSSSSSTSEQPGWRSSGSRSHHRNAPLIASDPDHPGQVIDDEAAELGVVLARSRDLPTTWYFSSNHIMINQERTAKLIAPLKRMRELDELAREQAQRMAEAKQVFHMKFEDLHESLDVPSRRLGSNVAKGATIRKIHPAMMENRADRNNILDRRFTHFGMGTAKSPVDGQLYLCQIFRG